MHDHNWKGIPRSILPKQLYHAYGLCNTKFKLKLKCFFKPRLLKILLKSNSLNKYLKNGQI